MCSVVTCHDVERNYEGIENVKNASFLVRSFLFLISVYILLFSYSKSFTKDQNDIFLPLFSRCLLTDQEHYALIALVMSELGGITLSAWLNKYSDTSDVSEEAHVILDRYRHEVLEDLQLHYQNELGLKEFSIKLGNLMTLNHAVQVISPFSSHRVILFFRNASRSSKYSGDSMQRCSMCSLQTNW